MPKLIIGFVGQVGSGKGTAAHILQEKYGATIFIFSGILTDVLNRLFLPSSRENLINMSMTLRQGFGQNVLAKTMSRQIEESNAEIVVVDGIRRLEDIEDLTTNPNFHLIEISVDPKVRFERLKKRNQKPGEAEMTWEDFLAVGQKETELTIAKVAEQAPIKLNNESDIQGLEKQLDGLVNKFSN
ncbi:MAG: AAA family ATPase [Patescibacteria group bacterium]|nr:AAA family ATPase [Patescibacteria group bacterium]